MRNILYEKFFFYFILYQVLSYKEGMYIFMNLGHKTHYEVMKGYKVRRLSR